MARRQRERPKQVGQQAVPVVDDRADEPAPGRPVGSADAVRGRLDRALDTQERIIAYRQSFRWWLALPWMRLKLLLARMAGPPA